MENFFISSWRISSKRRIFFRGLGEIEKENLASTSSDTNSSLTN